MKYKNQIIRLIIIVIIGVFLTYRIYQFRFSSFVFDLILVGGIAIIGFLYWLWTVYKDVKLYKIKKTKRFLIGPILGLFFIGVITGIIWKNESDLNKPTLIRVYYDGDFNGTGSDFKTDGTYIFNNSAIGLSDYTYGSYKIKGQKIKLDKKEIDNVIKSNILEFKVQKTNKTTESVNYLVQIRDDGNKLENASEFRVIVDNRKE